MTENNSKKISCIIPAYNEGERIGAVLEALIKHPLVSEIIVVDDGSIDETKEIVTRFDSVRLISHSANKGKAQAVATGLREAKEELVMFIDADLLGLSPDDITALIQPVLTGITDVTISLRINTPGLWRLIGLDYISGERVIKKDLFVDNIEKLKRLPRFGIEPFINKLIIAQNCKIKVVRWDHVKSPYKYAKFGIINGIRGDIGMIRDLFKVISPIQTVSMIIKMLRLKV